MTMQICLAQQCLTKHLHTHVMLQSPDMLQKFGVEFILG